MRPQIKMLLLKNEVPKPLEYLHHSSSFCSVEASYTSNFRKFLLTGQHLRYGHKGNQLTNQLCLWRSHKDAHARTCAYACTCTCIFVHTHALRCTRTCTHTKMHVHTHKDAHTPASLCTRTKMHMHTHKDARARAYTHTYRTYLAFDDPSWEAINFCQLTSFCYFNPPPIPFGIAFNIIQVLHCLPSKHLQQNSTSSIQTTSSRHY